MGRVLRAPRSTGVSRRSGLACAFGVRCLDDQRRESGCAAAERAAEHHLRQPADRVDGVPLRSEIWRSLPRRTVSNRSRRRALQTDDPGPQRAAAESESDLAEHGGAGRAVEGRDPDGTLRVRLLPAAGRVAGSRRHPRDDLDRDALPGSVGRSDREARKDSHARDVRRSPRRCAARTCQLGAVARALQCVRENQQRINNQRSANQECTEGAGQCQPPASAVSRSASAGPQVPGSYSKSGVCVPRIGSTIAHDASTAS